MIWRGAQVDGSTKPAVDATKDKLRVYPLAKRADPPKIKFINLPGKSFWSFTLPIARSTRRIREPMSWTGRASSSIRP